MTPSNFSIYKLLVESVFHEVFPTVRESEIGVPWDFEQITKGVMVALRHGVDGRGEVLLNRILQESRTPAVTNINGCSMPFSHVVDVISTRLQYSSAGA